jgi:hypothetical protein
VTVAGWVMLIGGGLLAVIPGMFQLVNGSTVLGLILVVWGAVILVGKGASNV